MSRRQTGQGHSPPYVKGGVSRLPQGSFQPIKNNMRAKLEITESGEHFAVIEKHLFIATPGAEEMRRLPDIKVPVMVNLGGSLSRGEARKLQHANGTDWQRYDPLSIRKCYQCRSQYVGTSTGRYCGDTCQHEAGTERANYRRRKKVTRCTCQTCGKDITGSRNTLKFCSNSCRQKAHRNAKTKPLR